MGNSPSLLNRAFEILNRVKKNNIQLSERKTLAVELTALMINEAKQIQTKEDILIQKQFSKMMDDPNGKVFTTRVTDQCFRSDDPYRVADQLAYTLKRYGIPKFASCFKKIQLRVFSFLGKPFARIFVPLAKNFLRKETRRVIVPGEISQLIKHIKKRHEEGVRINLNHLGEALLGEEEAKNRLRIYLEDLARPEIEYISVKITTIYSQINLLAWEHTIEKLAEKLRELYRAAMEHSFTDKDGMKHPKFVNLDMEEHRDLNLTVEVFKKVLNEPEFQMHYAGIVLQAYLPDSFHIQQKLTEWAERRVSAGGVPIKVRLVKGANLAMEQVEASIEGWPQTPFTNKPEVDANYKKMVHFGLNPAHASFVNIGIASHNLFDVAYALILRSENDVEEFVSFEMLEGMADHQRKVVQAIAKGILLYCPSATKEEFVNAVAYLVRRLDENTAPENFLRHVFDLTPGTELWDQQVVMFEKACGEIDFVSTKPRRLQNRGAPFVDTPACGSFENEPNTDWSLAENRLWIESVINQWKTKKVMKVPLSIGNEEVWNEEQSAIGWDPSRPDHELYRYSLATEEQVDQAIEIAQNFTSKWSNYDRRERFKIIAKVANKIRENRGDLIGCMMADAGKIVSEADAEISEAIDFCEYYRRNMEELYFLEDIEWSSKGVVLVTPPWNFPCAIPLGGVIAALTTGNTVIFKPAPETILVAWHLAKLCWEAGVPKEALQFIVCEDDPVGTRLIEDERINSVILTGATETAKLFYRLRPGLDLHAETGGKNAIIVTSLSDRDLVVKEVIHSAFGHAGQKCSACSLLILESEVYHSAQFRKQLLDAAASLKVGSPWDFSTIVNPLIHPPGKNLLRGMTELDEGEEWLLEPVQHPENPRLWSPGIKWGVKPGSFMHKTELFGPVLGVMCAEDLKEAIGIANDTPYGLTSGLHSLDRREQNYWLAHIEVGNCYINRGITGAIVQRQPFGGCKGSSYGQGAKAGGPNYLMQLMHARQKSFPKENEPVSGEVAKLCRFVERSKPSSEEIKCWNICVCNYAFYWSHYFSKEHDPSKLLGQDNYLKYVPEKGVIFRYQPKDTVWDALCVTAAALTCHCQLIISANREECEKLKKIAKIHQFSCINLQEQTDEELMVYLREHPNERVRLLSVPSKRIITVFGENATRHYIGPVLANGRIELLHYLREMSVSTDYHRYGNLGLREGEKRSPLPTLEGGHQRCQSCKNNGV
jgi:RHH-type transcriptional regulator, proline utilization regulon repressor / proline dehydrogenase / delta 1-pyrroline-5-carboxylate dehydrogenase